MGSSLSRTGRQIFFPFPDIELHWGRGVEFVYRDNFSLYITAIQEALKQNDFETIWILGHSMKGSGAGYGFDTISEIGKSVEQAAKEKNSEEIQKQVKALSAYLDRVEVVYE